VTSKPLAIKHHKKVVAVATSKLVEMEGLYPSSESKIRIAGLLADVIGLPPTALFDSVSRRGYLNKYLDNLRATQSPSKR
jgi:hypothetical protein